jgi:hypothetical protein
MEDQLIRGHEGVAEYTGNAITVRQSRRLVAAKRLPVIKPSGERGPVIVRASAIDAYLKACEQPAEDGPLVKAKRGK